jgi:uncharacterized protein YbaR (Trm112 family)
VVFTGFPLSPRWSSPLEVLACPHCDRLFQVTPEVLGKKIRCRGCRGVFHVPKDTTSVPLGPLEAMAALDDLLTPLAIPCVIDGHDARSCPECGRTFRMKESFAGKTIRCRGCRVTFRVRATAASPSEQVRPSPQPVPAAPVIGPPPPPDPPPTIFDDIGDVLDDLLPGEKVPPVVRPRNVPQLPPPASNTIATMIAVGFGGFCALPATAWILARFFPDRYREIVASLPDSIRGWLP